MIQPDPPARLPQVRVEDFTDDTRAFFEQWSGGQVVKGGPMPGYDQIANPVLRTFAHHPALAQAFSTFNLHLLGASTLSVRERQIAILRTAWITKATYMWSSHLNTSLTCGLSPDIFAAIQRGADDPYFTPFEATIILASEDMVNDRKVSDANWTALRAQWNEQQMLDFLFTIGAYVTIAGVMRSTGAERQEDLLALADQYGAP